MTINSDMSNAENVNALVSKLATRLATRLDALESRYTAIENQFILRLSDILDRVRELEKAGERIVELERRADEAAQAEKTSVVERLWMESLTVPQLVWVVSAIRDELRRREEAIEWEHNHDEPTPAVELEWSEWSGPMTRDEAYRWVSSLGRDWRLPTFFERKAHGKLLGDQTVWDIFDSDYGGSRRMVIAVRERREPAMRGSDGLPNL